MTDPAGAPAGRPIIRLDDVALTYPGPPQVEALRRCDLQVAAGEYVSVVGPSGSGKSTLLNIVGLLDRPTRGEYWLDGVSTGLLTERERTALRGRAIGFVFQQYSLVSHRTAVENVMLALLYTGVPRRQRRERAVAALHGVGLGHRVDSAATTLSGGEKQRVAIARAMVSGPRLMLCDEPTGNLDRATGEAVLDVLEALHAQGMTIVLITHDPTVSERAGRTVAVVDGVLGDDLRPVHGSSGE